MRTSINNDYYCCCRTLFLHLSVHERVILQRPSNNRLLYSVAIATIATVAAVAGADAVVIAWRFCCCNRKLVYYLIVILF